MSAVLKKRKITHEPSGGLAILAKKKKGGKKVKSVVVDGEKRKKGRSEVGKVKEKKAKKVGLDVEEEEEAGENQRLESKEGEQPAVGGVGVEGVKEVQEVQEAKKEKSERKMVKKAEEDEKGGKGEEGKEGERDDEKSHSKGGKEDQDQESDPLQTPPEFPQPQKTFADLGIMPSLIEACTNLGYKAPTPIQAESIPLALSGRDLIALAETGSGKTAAFALPILQSLWDSPRPLFACILAPTRELAFQIAEAFDALGGGIGVKTAVIVGGMDMVTQSMALGKRPHIIVATPGRLLDHLENTKGFSLRTLKYLVMDEADKLLDLDFGPSIDKILKVIPKDRRTYLFSATMTSKVEKLQRASLTNPLRVKVSSSKYQTVKTLLQYYILCPHKHKDTYLVYFVNEFAGQSIIIFTRTVNETQRLSFLLRLLGFSAVPLHGQLSQSARLGALTKFKSGARNILVATDVAARGLDIPHVDCILNYDLAQDSKTYIHRVGRTARAGRAGKSISLSTQYDVELLMRIEAALGKKLPEFPTEKETVLLFSERVEETQREAVKQMKEMADRKSVV